MIKGDRKPNCGVCGGLKKEGKGRLICPECSRRSAREFYRKAPKKPISESQRSAKYKNRKKLRPSGLSNQKVYAMKARYGITEDEFVSIKELQKGKCGICNIELTKDSLVDHDHESGRIRGILCRNCNFALGLFKDSENILNNAIKYLLR